jgi:hypothetical protein
VSDEVITKIDIPTDPAEIMEHLKVRHQAIKIMLADITMLSERLRATIGPVAWIEYMAKLKAAGDDDITNAYKLRQDQ